MQATLFKSTCCGARRGMLALLSRAAAKSAGAKLRQAGILPVKSDWAARAALCERCPLRVIVGKTSYCGRPFQQQISRDPTVDGCGCPTIAKAKDPTEHCPLDPRHRPASPATHGNGACTCKWCCMNPPPPPRKG